MPSDKTDLVTTQRWVAAQLRKLRALDKDATVVGEAARHLTGNDRLRPVDQIEIYREQFWLRHTASLVEDFPGLGGILGQADWERLVEGYLSEIPPESFSLRDLGERMPSYLERQTWLVHRDLCVDMARLEWAYVEVFDAADAAPLSADRLASIPEEAWQSARVVLAPALALLRVRYPVADLRKSVRSESEPVAMPDPAPQCLVLHRGANRNLFHESISDVEWELLAALHDGVPLVAACERACERAGVEAAAVETAIGGWFERWGRLGWIADVIA